MVADMTPNNRLSNGDSEQYWKGVSEGRLMFQRCRECSALQFPPRHQCAKCWKAELEWVESCGRGTVESFTIVRRAPMPSFRDRTPYVVAAILVEEGPRMLTNLVGDDALDVRMGDKVQVDFARDGSGEVLPQFRRVS